MDRRRYLSVLAAAGTGLAVAGCTDSDDGATPIGTGGSTPTRAGDETPDASTATPTSTPTPEPPADPDQRVAVGDGLSFDPDDFELAVGDTVLWEWVGGGHNVKYDDGAIPEASDWTGTEGSRTTTYGEGHAHWHTFEVPGEYSYYCVPHQGNDMTGRFTVVE
jgi:plastocyanin